LEGLAMEDVSIFWAIMSILRPNGIFYGHLVHFVVIWYILRSLGIFFTFLDVLPRKIWQPCSQKCFILLLSMKKTLMFFGGATKLSRKNRL
jgi:hypothetical protein